MLDPQITGTGGGRRRANRGIGHQIKDANARIEAQLRILTCLIVLVGILIAVIWLPPFIALFTRG